MAQKIKIQTHNLIEKQQNWFYQSFTELQEIKNIDSATIAFESLKKTILANAAFCQKTFDIEFVCFSKELFEVLKTMQLYIHSNHPVLFQGEHGTGKALLAKVMHNLRGGKNIIELSCQSENALSLQQRIRLFLDDSKTDGIIITRIDYLSTKELFLLEPLLHDFNGHKLIYLTANEDFIHNPPELASNIFYRLKHLVITIPSLINRLDDLFGQTIYFLLKYMDVFNVKYHSINTKSLKQFLRYLWPGNSRELLLYIQKMILENIPPEILSLAPFSQDDKSKAKSFTALEESEKKIIAHYLQKNNYNKAQTSRELDITINTLNTKIEKYDLENMS